MTYAGQAARKLGMTTEQQRQDLAQQLWTRENPLFQSGLVGELFHNDDLPYGSFDYDDIENLYPDPSDWSIEECQSWFDNNGDEWLRVDSDVDQYRDFITCNAEPAEPLEWWAVSSWFADKLRAEGECILDNDYGTWWGRTFSGESVVLDGVIQRIAVEVLS